MSTGHKIAKTEVLELEMQLLDYASKRQALLDQVWELEREASELRAKCLLYIKNCR